jgi:hypothetical protein
VKRGDAVVRVILLRDLPLAERVGMVWRVARERRRLAQGGERSVASEALL